MVSHRTQTKGRASYYASLVAFLIFLALLLLIIVDIRRGFLFSGYFKVGAPSALLNLDLRQLWLILVGSLGVWLSYRYIKKLETNFQTDLNLKTLTTVTAIAIGILLVIDLFTYRGVPASRFLAAGKMSAGPGPMGMGRVIPVTSFPAWLQPIGEGINYLLIVWHATTLGMLLGGLFLVAGAGLVVRMRGNSFVSHITGSALSLAQPFCSCCAAPIGSALYRKGASIGPVLAFTVSAPMLNITSLILAGALLPTEFAWLRIAGGIIVGVFVTYGVSLLAVRWISRDESEPKKEKLIGWGTKALNAYNRLFQFEKLFSEGVVESPSALISNWLGMTGRLARVMVPILLIGSILAVYIVELMPQTSNTFAGVLTTAFFGTLLMVPTWTEIPLAAGLINNGMSGIAAVVLITLPAVSIPCLSVLAGALNNVKVVLILGLSVLAAGIIAGVMFL